MKHITFYLDFISPYAWLAFHQMPQALQGHSYTVTYKPVLFGAILQHHGQLGPAEISAKRDWTYRQVLWLARQHGVPLTMPAAHPFNPLPLLRLALACDLAGLPNRYVCETLFKHVWLGGAPALDPSRLATLHELLTPQRDLNSAEVKTQLKVHTDEAIAAHVFGVPSLVVDGRVFWGFDALPMLAAYLDGDSWFEQAEWHSVSSIPVGIQRQGSKN